MIPRNAKLFFQSRVANIVLLAGMIFQLGACPCGCLEHNAWLDVVSMFFEADEQESTKKSIGTKIPTSSLANSDDHECTGELRDQFVDNSQSYRKSSGEDRLWVAAYAPINASGALNVMPDRQGHSTFWSLAFGGAPPLSALQVFQL